MTRSSSPRPWMVIVLLVTVLALAAAVFFARVSLSWLAEGQVKKYLKDHGVEVNSLSITSLSTEAVSLRRVSLGSGDALTIDQADLSFRLSGVELQSVSEFSLRGAKLTLYQDTASQWTIEGIEPLLQLGAKEEGASAFPTSRDDLPKLTPPKGALHSVKAGVRFGEWQAEAVFDADYSIESNIGAYANVDWFKAETKGVKLSVTNIVLKAMADFAQKTKLSGTVGLMHMDEGMAVLTSPGMNYSAELQGSVLTGAKFDGAQIEGKYDDGRNKKYEFQTKGYVVTMAYDEAQERFAGKVSLKQLAITGLPQEVPPMDVSGWYFLDDTTFYASLNGSEEKGGTRFDIELRVPLANPAAGAVKVTRLSFPWGSGDIVLSGHEWVAFGLDRPAAFGLSFKGVKLSRLLEEIAGGQVSASGKLDGSVPIVYYPDGRIVVKDGSASAEGTGTLSLSPEVLGGNQASQQVQIAGKVLENFHYTTLTMNVTAREDESAALSLKIHGNNPDAFGGKPVHLNVNLTGDIIPLIRQSLLPIADARQYLKMQGE